MVTIQRAIEIRAIPAVLLTVDPEQSEQGRPSRAFYPEGFTLGHATALRPGQVELQKLVIMDALSLLLNPVEPGTIARKRYEVPVEA